MVKYAGRTNEPSDNLYLTGLPNTVTENLLVQMFQVDGFTVTRAKVIADAWGNGYSAGMVSVGSVEEATKAIQMYNGQVIENSAPAQASAPTSSTQLSLAAAADAASRKPLTVKYAGNADTPSEHVHLSGLPGGVSEAMVKQMLTETGFTVRQAKIVADEFDASCSGALATLASQDEAALAIKLLSGQVLQMS
eukprot:TRINITY_DN57438_c0_g1_i1.p1 TRINITY_DN57438_c0_g1~~TRINITY_DN57438_c0_g1_i1.p1  ORF type:complete len:193 (-),score=31.50 TRINITY_DN57438_c0_g1_i1:146-724(-)